MIVNLLNKDTVTIWRNFFVSISMIILVFALGIFLGMFFQGKELIEGEMLTRSRSHFDNIVLTRAWNARHGGVYVEKTEGMESNPYLENPDMTAVDGRVYTKKNPALMTREISEMAEQKGDYRFHITSLKPLNPINQPDAFEAEALRRFEQDDVKEVFTKEKTGDDTFFRYMAPLTVTAACLNCHGKQGYAVGDVRGGISVRFNINDVEAALTINGLIIGGLFVLTAVTMLILIYGSVYKLTQKIAAAEHRIRELAVTDALTGLFNRRFLWDRLAAEMETSRQKNRPLSCVMLDIDHFKKINDTYGHDIGDQVLRTIGKRLRDQSPAKDCVARYGGEEFVQILPETAAEAAMAAAERLRLSIAERAVLTDRGPIQVTSSFGVAGFSAAEIGGMAGGDDIIKAADEALYLAKHRGRNRVELASGK